MISSLSKYNANEPFNCPLPIIIDVFYYNHNFGSAYFQYGQFPIYSDGRNGRDNGNK